jgi:hypothetical protein
MRPSTHVPTPEYPSAIPADAQVVVPLPVESYPEWTTDLARFNDKLRCFAELISLPDPQEYPAYYAAAADTIWLTNMRLQAHAPYKPDALPKAVMDEICKKWRAKHLDENAFPFPPDRRTLLVKAKEVHPFEGGDRRWSRACRLYERVTTAQKQVYLGKSRADIEKTYEYTVTDDLYTDFFLRYLAWREHVLSGGEDIQPSRQQLQNFFGEPAVKASGATLANVQQAIPGARDARMLVYRIEGIAQHTPRRKDPNGLHPDERVESIYIRKTIPTHHEIKGKVEEVLKTHGPMPLSEILEHLYPFGFGHEDSITRVVKRIAHPTINEEGFGLAVMPAPSAFRIREEISTINGRIDTELEEWAELHLLSPDGLMAPLTHVAYFGTDLRWYARFPDASASPSMTLPPIPTPQTRLGPSQTKRTSVYDQRPAYNICSQQLQQT